MKQQQDTDILYFDRISLKFVPGNPIDSKSAFVQVMADQLK